jgi:hypothetical protein
MSSCYTVLMTDHIPSHIPYSSVPDTLDDLHLSLASSSEEPSPQAVLQSQINWIVNNFVREMRLWENERAACIQAIQGISIPATVPEAFIAGITAAVSTIARRGL